MCTVADCVSGLSIVAVIVADVIVADRVAIPLTATPVMVGSIRGRAGVADADV